MKLLALSIDGFRGIQHAIIRFGEHDVVVGPNGSGKSTIIDALSLVFGSLFSGSPTGDRALEPVEVPRKVGCRRRGATCVALSTKEKGSRSYTG